MSRNLESLILGDGVSGAISVSVAVRRETTRTCYRLLWADSRRSAASGKRHELPLRYDEVFLK
ncbi:UNVERIFIED_ORG: hypothetical protein J2W85_002410 [Ensifer adhaerens]|nr:hypothetical protein [Ensifer adhaerens]